MFVDVGVNAGQSAISFIMNFQSKNVISFEPYLLYLTALDVAKGSLGKLCKTDRHTCVEFSRKGEKS